MNKRFKSGLGLVCVLVGISLGLPAQEAKKEEAPPSAIADPADALKDIPRDVMGDLRPGSRQMMDAAAKASMQTAKNAEGKTGTFKFNVRAVEKFQRPDAPDVTRFRILAVVDTVRASGVQLNVHLMAVLDLAEHEKAAKIGTGSKVTLTGKISNAEILGRQKAELHIDLMDARIK